MSVYSPPLFSLLSETKFGKLVLANGFVQIVVSLDSPILLASKSSSSVGSGDHANIDHRSVRAHSKYGIHNLSFGLGS